MPGGVGVLCPEGGAEGIDVLESHGEGLAVELAGNRQVGGLTEEILAEIHLAVFGFGNVVQVKRSYLEHFSGTLAVGAGNQGRMDIHKVPLLEELMDGIGSQAAHAEHRLEQVGAGAQMGHGTQKFYAVALLLHGVVAGGLTFHYHAGSLNLKGLGGIGGQQ